jgi:hypothetical protein
MESAEARADCVSPDRSRSISLAGKVWAPPDRQTGPFRGICAWDGKPLYVVPATSLARSWKVAEWRERRPMVFALARTGIPGRPRSHLALNLVSYAGANPSVDTG